MPHTRGSGGSGRCATNSQHDTAKNAKAGSRRCSNSNAHCKDQNNADAGDQNGQRRPVVFEPSPILTELTHDNKPLLRAVLFVLGPKMAQWDGFAVLVAPAGRKVHGPLVVPRGRISLGAPSKNKSLAGMASEARAGKNALRGPQL
jgi:hypothetical protein